MENKKDLSKLFLIIFVIISLVLAGFILYDKVLKKEEVKTCLKTDCQCEKCSNTAQCNCANNALGEKISSLKKITLTTTNQTVKIGNKEYKVRVDDDNHLLINDKSISNWKGEEVYADYAYLTDKFFFVTTVGQFYQWISYAINEDGEIIGDNDNNYTMHDFKLVDGYLHATGNLVCFDTPEYDDKDCKDKDLIIKFIDNTLIVTPYK